MSGTSADGIDVAFIEVSISPAGFSLDAPPSVRLLHYTETPYSPDLKGRILAQRREPEKCSLGSFTALAADIGHAYAAAIKAAAAAAGINLRRDVIAVGIHGQTMFHCPPLTLQWVDPSIVAEHCGCDVVADFRRADCAAGGQGAPLVPFADLLLYSHPSKNRVLVNLGGIANISCIPALSVAGAEASRHCMLAFDTGPANCLMDWLVREAAAEEAKGEKTKAGLEGGQAGGAAAALDPAVHSLLQQALSAGFDPAGQLAGAGKEHPSVVHAFLQQAYFQWNAPADVRALLLEDGSCATAGKGERDHLFLSLDQGSKGRAPPCSTDTPAMLEAWQAALLAAGESLSLPDSLRTAAACTVETLARGIEVGCSISRARMRERLAGRQEGSSAAVRPVVASGSQPSWDWEVVVSGGGARNATLLQMLRERLVRGGGGGEGSAAGSLPSVRSNSVSCILTAEEVDIQGQASSSSDSDHLAMGAGGVAAAGAAPPSSSGTGSASVIPSQAKEAVAFALLAAAHVHRVPASIPSCTGARRACLLGALYPAQPADASED